MTEADLLYVVRGAHEKLQARARYACGLTGAVPYDFKCSLPLRYRHDLEREIKRGLYAPMFAGAALAAMRTGENEHGPIYDGDRFRVAFKQRPGESWRAEVTLGEVTVEYYLGAPPTQTPMEVGERVHREGAYSFHTPEAVDETGHDVDWKTTPPTETVTGRMSYAGAVPLAPRVDGSIAVVGAFPRIPPEGIRGLLTKPDGSKANVTIHADGRVVEDAPAPDLYDGLTAAQCLARFVHLQRHGEANCVLSGAYRQTLGLKPLDAETAITLTPDQRDAAHAAWSAELRAKAEASAAEDRAHQRANEVVVDDDRWEP